MPENKKEQVLSVRDLDITLRPPQARSTPSAA